MSRTITSKYESSLEADADVHGGGHFAWSLYRDVLILYSDSTAEIRRVASEFKEINLTKEKKVLSGSWMGYYSFDLSNRK